MAKKISQKGINFIKKHEGCVLHAYRCSAGVLTIGYGHTKDVKEGDVITQEEADNLLQSDLAVFEKAVSSAVKVELTQGQFDALVSFAFNVGIGNFRKSLILKNINKGNIEEARRHFTCYTKAGGRKLAGLAMRRKREREMFDDRRV